MGRRLTQFTSGRSSVLPERTTPASVAASAGRPLPDNVPTAAEHHSVAAVFRPRMLARAEKADAGHYVGDNPRRPFRPEQARPRSENAAAPTATSTFVRRPADRCRHCRSRPMRVPNTKDTAYAMTV